jgi:hypothetical protein
MHHHGHVGRGGGEHFGCAYAAKIRRQREFKGSSPSQSGFATRSYRLKPYVHTR